MLLQIKAIRDGYATLEVSLVNDRQGPRDEIEQFKDIINRLISELSTHLRIIANGLEHCHEVCIVWAVKLNAGHSK